MDLLLYTIYSCTCPWLHSSKTADFSPDVSILTGTRPKYIYYVDKESIITLSVYPYIYKFFHLYVG